MCFTLPPVRRRSRTPVRDKGVISAAALDLVCKQERDSAMKAMQAEILQLKAERQAWQLEKADLTADVIDLQRCVDELMSHRSDEEDEEE
jgi:hypothetical protein